MDKLPKSRLGKYKSNWEDLADLDPLWAVLSHQERKYGNWNREDFLSTGRDEVQKLMRHATQFALPRDRMALLDFGCGVGRLTETFLRYFEHYYGVDISEKMLLQAKNMTRAAAECNFILTAGDGLLFFRDNSFDLVYSSFVLQHMPRHTIEFQISEFLRVLRHHGLLVFQLPSYVPLVHRLQPGRRLYQLLKAARISKQFLYNKMGLHPNRMSFIPEEEVMIILQKSGGELVEVERDRICGHTLSATYYVTRN